MLFQGSNRIASSLVCLSICEHSSSIRRLTRPLAYVGGLGQPTDESVPKVVPAATEALPNVRKRSQFFPFANGRI
jgi:hypothetical protein